MSNLIYLDKCSITLSAPFDWENPQDPVRQFTEKERGEILKCWYVVDGSMICLYKGKYEQPN